MQMKTKTNAMRMLDAAKIPYEVLEYRVDEDDLSGVFTLPRSWAFRPNGCSKRWWQKGIRQDLWCSVFPWRRRSTCALRRR